MRGGAGGRVVGAKMEWGVLRVRLVGVEGIGQIFEALLQRHSPRLRLRPDGVLEVPIGVDVIKIEGSRSIVRDDVGEDWVLPQIAVGAPRKLVQYHQIHEVRHLPFAPQPPP